MIDPGGDIWRMGAEWCDSHHCGYPPRCQGGCRRTFIRLKMDRVGLGYDIERGPVCEDCERGMGEMATHPNRARVDWESEHRGRPLWQTICELAAGGGTPKEISEELARQGVEVYYTSVGRVLKRYRGPSPARGGDDLLTPPAPLSETASGLTGEGGDSNGDGGATPFGGTGASPVRCAEGPGPGERPTGEAPVAPRAGTEGDEITWRIAIDAPGFMMRAEGRTREELCERLQLIDGVLA